MFDITGKHAIITGRGHGIGRAFALGFACAGARAVLFMAAPTARRVYGQNLIVDGGLTLFGG